MFFLGMASIALIYTVGSGNLPNALIKSSISPLGSEPLFQTIAELQKLGSLGWALWPGIFLIPITVGLLLIVWNICKTLNLYPHWTMGSIEVIVFGIAFSRLFSGASVTNFTETSVTLTIYWTSAGIGILGLISGFIHARLRRGFGRALFDHTAQLMIFLVTWSIFTFILLRIAIRFVFLFVIPGTILGGYAIVWTLKRYIQESRLLLLYLFYTVLILWEIHALSVDRINRWYISVLAYISLTILTTSAISLIAMRGTLRLRLLYKLGATSIMLYMICLVSLSPSPAFGGYAFEVRKRLPSMLLAKEKPVQNALEWIRKNAGAKAVIAANWEYGGWINLLGNRATIVDEQQRIRWTNLIAKELFIENDITSALEFLKTHEVDYLFLTTRDIRILSQIARGAGMQEDSIDILFFGNVVQKTSIEVENKLTKECYRYCCPDWQIASGTFDLKMDDRKCYSAERWCIYSIYLQLEKIAGSLKIVNALTELQVDGITKYVTPQRIFYRDSILYPGSGEHLPGSVIICTGRNNTNNPEKWHVIYLNPGAQQLLPIRIFLLGEMPEIFERVFPPPGCKDPSEYTAQVWKIHYPPGIKTRPESLEMGSLAPTDF